MTEIVEIISNVGFPIAMCVYFIVHDNKQQETLQGFKESLEKNTTVLNKICDILGIEKEV